MSRYRITDGDGQVHLCIRQWQLHWWHWCQLASSSLLPSWTLQRTVQCPFSHCLLSFPWLFRFVSFPTPLCSLLHCPAQSALSGLRLVKIMFRQHAHSVLMWALLVGKQVGPNGCGKSTLLKLMTGALDPVDGMVKRHNHLRIGQYHQHLTELLPLELSPLEYMVSERKRVGLGVGGDARLCAYRQAGLGSTPPCPLPLH